MARATLGLSSSIRGMYKTIRFALCLSLMTLNLAGCSMSASQDAPEQRAARPEMLKTSVSATEARDLARPANDNGSFSVQSSQVTTGFSGLKTNDLFTENISDSNDRFDRLEGTVQDIRNEINAVAPSINRLITIEGDIQNLIVQLETLLSEEPPPSPAIAAPKAKTSKPKPKEAPKQPYTPHTGTPILQKIRMSDNPKATRLVLETRGKMKYTAELDNNEQLLTLFFETGKANEAISKTPLRSTLIKAISPTPQTKGLILAVSLGAHSRIIKQGVIAPSADNHNYRIYIDLAK